MKKESIVAAIEPAVNELNLFLEDVVITSAGKHSMLRILIDGETGLSMDQVTEASFKISEIIDQMPDIGQNPFTLEVSTPGAEYPLTLPRHWFKNLNRLVSVTLLDGEKFVSRITSIENEEITFTDSKENITLTKISDIKSAYVEIEFK